MNTSKKRGAILALIGLVASGLAIGGSAAQADTAPARQSPMHDADAQCQSAGSWYITVDSVPNGVTVVDLVFDQAEAYETGYKPSANTWEVNYSGGTLSGYVLFSNDFRAYFSGSGDCTIVVPPPPPPVKPPVCHPVNGNGETGTGWNIIGPDQASSHIDENLYPDGEYWKHMSNDGRHDVYAENGQCPAPPVDLVSDGTAVLCGTELVVVIFASEGPLTFGVALIDRGNGDITSLGDPEFNENVATFTATIDPNEATAPVTYNVATEDGRHSEGFAEITIDENCETPVEHAVSLSSVVCIAEGDYAGWVIVNGSAVRAGDDDLYDTAQISVNGGEWIFGNWEDSATFWSAEYPEGANGDVITARLIHKTGPGEDDFEVVATSETSLTVSGCPTTPTTTVPPTTPGTTAPPVTTSPPTSAPATTAPPTAPTTPTTPTTPTAPSTPPAPPAAPSAPVGTLPSTL